MVVLITKFRFIFVVLISSSNFLIISRISILNSAINFNRNLKVRQINVTESV